MPATSTLRASSLKSPERTRSSTTSAPYSWLQTANDLPNDEFHVATAAANLGWALNSTTQIRGTLHYGVSATGVPNAMGLLSRRRRRHPERSGHLRQRLHRQPDHGQPAQQRSLRPHAQTRAGISLDHSGNSSSSTAITASALGLSATPSPSPAPTATPPPARRSSIASASASRSYRLQPRSAHLSRRHHHHSASGRPHRLSI